jgi:hypothetical protein
MLVLSAVVNDKYLWVAGFTGGGRTRIWGYRLDAHNWEETSQSMRRRPSRPPVEAQDAKLPGAAPQTPLHILAIFTSGHVHYIHLVAAG